MKHTREYYLNLPYQMVVKPRKDYFIAYYKEYPEIIGTGDSDLEAIMDLKAARECLVDDCIKHGEELKEPLANSQKQKINITLSKSLIEKIDKITKNRSAFLEKVATYALQNKVAIG